MAITTRSEYGMRAMILLAEQLGDELLSTAEVARRAYIPRKYLEQILRDLKRGGLVLSQAGVHGGYRLARPAARITAGQIVRCLDHVDVMGCVSKEPKKKAPCDHLRGCALRPLWQRLQGAIHEVLDATTLEQLAFNPCLAAPDTAVSFDGPDEPDLPAEPAATSPPNYRI